jgi:hypothetical protein
MPDRPFLSLGTVILGGTFGMDPVGFNTLNAFSGQIVDSATRVEWVDLVRQSGRQRVRIDGGATVLGLSVGPVGLQVGSSMYANFDLSPDLFEAMMFGNAGNNNEQPKALNLAGTDVTAAGFTTAALSFALPLPLTFTAGVLPNEGLAAGITGKYVTGNALLVAVDGGSVFGSNSMTLNFPMVAPADSGYDGILGSGTAADLALSWIAGPWRVGVVAENVYNSFKWDTTRLSFLRGAGYFDQDTSYSDDSTYAFSQAPQALRDQVLSQSFKPAINIGLAFKATERLTLTADIHQQSGGDDVITIGPKNRMGVGVELRLLPFVPLRAGVASVSDGWQAGAGFGLHVLGYELGVSGGLRRRGAANEGGFMIGLVGIGR